MKPLNSFLLSILLIFSSVAFSQTDGSEGEDENIYTIVQRSAQFPGGVQGFYTFLGENLNYPEEAFQKGMQGSVYVQFIIEKDGSITDVVAIKGIGAGCDEEAVRALKLMPSWTPAFHENRLVRQQMVQKITFKLPESVSSISDPIPASAKIIVDEIPEYTGGKDAYLEYLENIDLKCKKCPNSRFTVQFYVEKNGSIRDVEIVDGMGTVCDERLKQAFRDMPKWDPAKAAGKPKRYGFLQSYIVECN